MHLSEICCFIDVGKGIWTGTGHCQPPMSPKEFSETIDLGAAWVRDLCHRQCLKLSQLQEVQIAVLRVETVEAADLPTKLAQLPVILPGHRRATHCDWEFIARDEQEVTNGDGA